MSQNEKVHFYFFCSVNHSKDNQAYVRGVQKPSNQEIVFLDRVIYHSKTQHLGSSNLYSNFQWRHLVVSDENFSKKLVILGVCFAHFSKTMSDLKLKLVL